MNTKVELISLLCKKHICFVISTKYLFYSPHSGLKKKKHEIKHASEEKNTILEKKPLFPLLFILESS